MGDRINIDYRGAIDGKEFDGGKAENFSLVLGELVPKRIGLSRPEYLAKNFAKPMSWLSKITFPFIWLLTSSTHLIVKLFKLKVSDNQVTEEEIKAMVAEGSEHGAIEEEEKEIIERLFHLGDRNITSLMTHRTDIAWFDGSETVQQVKDNLIDNVKNNPAIKNLLETFRGEILEVTEAKPA